MIHKITQRKTFSKILVAVRESRKSVDKAVAYAVSIAKDYDASLVVLYIIPADAGLHTLKLPNYVPQMKKHAQTYLTKLSEKVHKESNKNKVVKIKTEIVTSNRIPDAIVNYAKDNKIDLIIIATRGRSKIKSVVLGSITPDVIRRAHCPVLTVR